MNVYLYQAALWCGDCIAQIELELMNEGRRPVGYPNETLYDSDEYPKGPYAASEADVPDHCDGCGLFLENPLTADGIDYVREAIQVGDDDPDVLAKWQNFYKLEVKR